MFKLIEYLNNSLGIKENKPYFYGWKRGSKWEEQKKNFLVDKFSVFTIFEYNNLYDNIKFVDLRNNYNEEVYNQLNLNSSTANAVAFCFHYDQIKNYNKSVIKPSRLFIYYNERQSLNNQNENENEDGNNLNSISVEIFDSINVLYNLGVCPECMYIYEEKNFNNKPDVECYKEALNNKLIVYNAIDQNLHQLKAALIEGYPVLCGVNIYSNFETDDVKETGNIKLPNDEDNLVGGLAITLVGFDEGDKVFIAKNSWGAEWGDNGYCYIPYNYILDPKLSSDFWIIRKTYENKETEF